MWFLNTVERIFAKQQDWIEATISSIMPYNLDLTSAEDWEFVSVLLGLYP